MGVKDDLRTSNIRSFDPANLSPEQRKILEHSVRIAREAWRPVDQKMIDDLHRHVTERAVCYAHLLRAVLDTVHHDDPRKVARDNEHVVAQQIKALESKLQMWGTNITAAINFLREVRVRRTLEPIRLGPVCGDSAHSAALLLFNRVTDLWKLCRDQFLNDPTFRLSGTTTSHLFSQQWIADETPSFHDIQAALQLEHAAATDELRAPQSQSATGPAVHVRAERVTIKAPQITTASGQQERQQDKDLLEQVRRLKPLEREVLQALLERKVLSITATNKPGQATLAHLR